MSIYKIYDFEYVTYAHMQLFKACLLQFLVMKGIGVPQCCPKLLYTTITIDNGHSLSRGVKTLYHFKDNPHTHFG